MQTEIRSFLENQVTALLKNLHPDTPAKWGIMDAHHMIEHLSSILYISYKDIGLKTVTPAEKLERTKQFLWNDLPMRRHFYIRGVHFEKPAPYKFESLEKAKTILLVSIGKFYQHYTDHPTDHKIHPIFGSLNLEEWERFHRKHIVHHFTQFGLIEETDKV